MSPELSRRVARLMMFEPIRHLPPGTRRLFLRAVHTATTFDDLAPEFRDLITSAESVREHYIAQRPHSVA